MSHKHYLRLSLRKLQIGLLLLIAIAIPLTVFLNQQIQNNQQQAAVSNSKLGVFLLGDCQAGEKIIRAGPKVVTILNPEKNMRLIRLYKQMYPDGIVVARVYGGNGPKYTTANDPAAAAQSHWNNVLRPAMSQLSASDRALISYLSAALGDETTPPIRTAADATWTNTFWREMARIISENGYRPNIGEIYVGNIFDLSHLDNLQSSLKQSKDLGGIWSYHGYTIDYTTDTAVEIHTSLRYRQYYDRFRQINNMELANGMNMILTEAGVDHVGEPAQSGWQARGDAGKFQNWLQWYDGQIKQDARILGATIFQVCDTALWSSFSIDPIADWFAGYLSGTPVAQPTSQPQPTAGPQPTTPPNNPQPTAQPTPVPPPPNQNQRPVGALDLIDAQGIARGWTRDPNAPNYSIQAHFFVDGPEGQGQLAGATVANQNRSDVGNHAFTFIIPTRFRDGQTHRIYAYGLDASGGPNGQLLQSPMSFRLTGQAPQPTPTAGVGGPQPTTRPQPTNSGPLPTAAPGACAQYDYYCIRAKCTTGNYSCAKTQAPWFNQVLAIDNNSNPWVACSNGNYSCYNAACGNGAGGPTCIAAKAPWIPGGATPTNAPAVTPTNTVNPTPTSVPGNVGPYSYVYQSLFALDGLNSWSRTCQLSNGQFGQCTNWNHTVAPIIGTNTDYSAFGAFTYLKNGQQYVTQALYSKDGANGWSRECPINPSTGPQFNQCTTWANAAPPSITHNNQTTTRYSAFGAFTFTQSGQQKLAQSFITQDGGTGFYRYCDISPTNGPQYNTCNQWTSVDLTLENPTVDRSFGAYDGFEITQGGQQKFIQSLYSFDGTKSMFRVCPIDPTQGPLYNQSCTNGWATVPLPIVSTPDGQTHQAFGAYGDFAFSTTQPLNLNTTTVPGSETYQEGNTFLFGPIDKGKQRLRQSYLGKDGSTITLRNCDWDAATETAENCTNFVSATSPLPPNVTFRGYSAFIYNSGTAERIRQSFVGSDNQVHFRTCNWDATKANQEAAINCTPFSQTAAHAPGILGVNQFLYGPITNNFQKLRQSYIMADGKTLQFRTCMWNLKNELTDPASCSAFRSLQLETPVGVTYRSYATFLYSNPSTNIMRIRLSYIGSDDKIHFRSCDWDEQNEVANCIPIGSEPLPVPPPTPPAGNPNPAVVPNCSNLQGPTIVRLGQSVQYTAQFSSPEKNGLIGLINAVKSTNTTPKDPSKWEWSIWPATDIPTNSGNLSFTWRPTEPGLYQVFCRAWNADIAECRGADITVDGPPRYKCAGPGSSMTVNVTNASIGEPGDQTDMCQSATVFNGDNVISPKKSVTIAAIAKPDVNVKQYNFAFYNLDKDQPVTNPKPIFFSPNTNFMKSVKAPSNDITVGYEEVNKPDLNNGGKIPTNLQVNAYFVDADGNLSAPDPRCTVFLRISNPSPTQEPTVIPTLVPAPPADRTTLLATVGVLIIAVIVSLNFFFS